ncbi:MAG: hypothetical protein RR263_04565, partial [Oscillospiraceae bacterium]
LSKELSVLKHTKMAASLVEVDFISNIAAERDLKVENNIKAVAVAIKNSVISIENNLFRQNLSKISSFLPLVWVIYQFNFLL